MIFTNSSGNMQPYVSWKSEYNMIETRKPINAKPMTNGDNISLNRTGKALVPIKHWRKQLTPITNATDISCINEHTYVIQDRITKNNNANDSKITKYGQPDCISCDPKSKIIKSARTLTTKNYCRDTKEYLRKKCLSYDQNLTGSKKDGIIYIDNGRHVWPSDSSTGSQIRKPLDCYEKSSCNVIYKPNNVNYSTQGAVSSSNRLLRLKVDTITNNGNSFRSAWGEEAANAAKYHGTSEAPYFLKNKSFVPTKKNCNCDLRTLPKLRSLKYV